MEAILCVSMCFVWMIVGYVFGRNTVKTTIIYKNETPPAELLEERKIKNPMEVYKEKKQEKVDQAELNKFETILHNIESYDGTGMGQKDIPR